MITITKLHKSSIVFLTFLVLLLSGCKSGKFASISSGGQLESKTKDQLLEDVITSQLDFKTIAAKASVEIVRPKSKFNIKTNCYIKIIKDTELQLSVRMPFINSEIFRINITPDSLYLLDRLNKNYAVESINEYSKKYNIDLNYYNLQSVLTNTLFIPGKNSISRRDFNLFTTLISDSLFYLDTKDKNNTLYRFAVNAKDRIESINVYNQTYKLNIQWLYNNFVRNADSQIYPTNIVTNIEFDNRKMLLNISYSSLDINPAIQIDRQIPTKYQKKTLTAILGNFIK